MDQLPPLDAAASVRRSWRTKAPTTGDSWARSRNKIKNRGDRLIALKRKWYFPIPMTELWYYRKVNDLLCGTVSTMATKKKFVNPKDIGFWCCRSPENAIRSMELLSTSLHFISLYAKSQRLRVGFPTFPDIVTWTYVDVDPSSANFRTSTPNPQNLRIR